MIWDIGMLMVAVMTVLVVLVGFGVWLRALVSCLGSDMASGEKALWILLIVFLNLIGALVYLLLSDKVSSPGLARSPTLPKKSLAWIMMLVFGLAFLFIVLFLGTMFIGLQYYALSKTSDVQVTSASHQLQATPLMKVRWAEEDFPKSQTEKTKVIISGSFAEDIPLRK